MAYQVATFDDQRDYEGWLRHAGETVRIVSTSASRRNWTLGAGFFTNAQTLTVTYEVVAAHAPDPHDYTMFRDRARSRALIATFLAVLAIAVMLVLVAQK